MRKPIPALTGLRFLLAFWVILYHEGSGNLASLVSQLPHPIYSFITTGVCAVGFFFVLSGFILAYNYDLGHRWPAPNFKEFAVARFARIYPIYLLGLVLMVPENVNRLFHQTATALPVGVLQFVALQAWFPPALGVWNSPGWSISNEAFFYLLFPILGVGLWRLQTLSSAFVAVCSLWIAGLLVPGIFVLRHVPGVDITALTPNHHNCWLDFVRYNPLLRLPEFLIGIVAAKIFFYVQPAMQGKGYWLYGPAGLLILLILGNADTVPYPFLHNTLIVPLAATMLIGLALGGGFPVQALAAPWMVLLGSASYAMYILQVPVLVYLQKLPIHWTLVTWGITYFGIVIGVSCWAHLKFEEPANRALKQWFTRQGALQPRAV